MAKYAYAPLSIDQSRRRRTSSDQPSQSTDHDDALVQERLPVCIGICVLLAIVYVLSRTGDQDAAIANNPYHNNNIRSEAPPPVIPTKPSPSSTAVHPEAAKMKDDPDDWEWPEETPSSSSSSTISSSSTTKTSGTAKTQEESLSSSSSSSCQCDYTALENKEQVIAQLRHEALSKSAPFIIECSAADAGESQAACHLPPKERFAALGQKGATLWMTGCSGAGKTTIATALEDRLVKEYGKHVYRLDGDNLRTGLNRDLTFTEADRAESVRRTGELATLFADAGVITLVGLISPYEADRNAVRKRHEDMNIPFYEVFLDVPIDELEKRDPKGLYAQVESGKIKHFTCIDDPYDPPRNPEITLKTHELEIAESANILLRRLERDGILMGAPKLAPPGLPNPDGDVIVDRHLPERLRESRRAEAETLPKVLITDIDLNWLQTIGEGWASPLKGFMREGTLLETLHFNSILTDPFNVTGNIHRHEQKTNFDHFPPHVPNNRVSMPLPITLACTSYTKDAIESSGKSAVALVTQMGHTVAILRDPEIYNNRKEEIVTRMYGVIDFDHPYIRHIYSGGDYLIGGEIELLDRIRYNDGLDKWRKTAKELVEEFKEKGADTVYAFQTRNPTHAGHAYLMREAGKDLRQKGYQNPVLWLSPLGGWTKEDDVPLDVRVKQHEYVLAAGTTHPGGLDPATTVMAIWPAPMVYAGPTEVQFHAKSRRSAGASYFVVGRDPAGMKGSPNALAHPDDDLYDGNHGRYVLQYSPGLQGMQMLSFVKVMYDITDNVMKVPDPNRKDDFISISGTKMRLLARNGATPCSRTNIPTDLEAANCIPSGFMVKDGWDTVVDYYRNIEDASRWTPWSKPIVPPPAYIHTKYKGKMGFDSFMLRSTEFDSWWHDVPVRAGQGGYIVNMVTEIPMYMTAKMELNKDAPHNPIQQDTNSDGSTRYYSYGTPFFNYGLIPQTWEDPSVKSTDGYGGDNDPLDIMELGSRPLQMGSVEPCRVIGSLELIDEGETDHKIICIALSDPDADRIQSIEELEKVKPGHLDRLRDWLKRYKTSDGKPENPLASETPRTAKAAMMVIKETHDRWRALCRQAGSFTDTDDTRNFWLASPGCRGS